MYKALAGVTLGIILDSKRFVIPEEGQIFFGMKNDVPTSVHLEKADTLTLLGALRLGMDTLRCNMKTYNTLYSKMLQGSRVYGKITISLLTRLEAMSVLQTIINE